MGRVQMVSALVYSQCKLSADDCKSCETRNLDGEASDHDVNAEINLSQIQHPDCDITVHVVKQTMVWLVNGKIDAMTPPMAWINRLKTSHATNTKVYVRGFSQLIS